MSRPRLGILLSGRGSNFRAIHQAVQAGRLQADIAVVCSNRADAPGLLYAREQGVPAICLEKSEFPDRAAYDAAMAQALREHRVDVVVLAGYDRILGPDLLEAFPGRILNIHPSLLPKFGGKGMVGLKVHAAVLGAGEAESGCSVHVVTDTVDGGPVLGQARVPVSPQDTPETLAAKILEQEHQLYPTVIQQYLQELSRHAQLPTSS